MSESQRKHFAPTCLCGVTFPFKTKRAVAPGQVYSRLTVLGEPFYLRTEKSSTSSTHVVCLCECGRITVVRTTILKCGKTRSCGCLWSGPRTHGASESRLYRIWSGMKYRCGRETTHAYQWYGGRGIAVCDEWLNDFSAFENWSHEHGYRAGLTIDRIDNDGGYCPDNCRWSSLEEQGAHRRNVVMLSAFGETKSVGDWSRDQRCTVKFATLRARVTIYGWPAESAITTPLMAHGKRFSFDTLS